MGKQTCRVIRAVASFLACLLCILPLSACMFNAPKFTNLEDIKLNNVLLAIGSNPQTAGGDILRYKHGLVIFIMKDGTTQFVKTSGMFSQNLVWTSKGLFFTDRDRDYHLWEKNGRTYSSIAKFKHDPYEAAAIINTQGDPTFVFNNGMTPNGDGTYQHNELELHYPLSAKKNRTVDSDIFDASAYCGTDLYAVTHGYSKNLSRVKSPQFLQNLDKGTSEFVDLSVLLNTPSRVFNVISGTSRSYSLCHNGIFSMGIAEFPENDFMPGDSTAIYHERWNIQTNDITVTPIRTASSHHLKIADVQNFYPLDTDRFLITTLHGVCYIVNRNDVATRLPLDKKYPSEGGSVTTSTQQYIFTLLIDPTEANIIVRDAKAGKILETIKCDDQITSRINGSFRLNATSIVANPNLTYTKK